MSAKIKYLTSKRRIKLSRHFVFGRRYFLQVRIKFFRWNIWKSIAWTYPEIHGSYDSMFEYLIRQENKREKERMQRNFYGYNPLTKTP